LQFYHKIKKTSIKQIQTHTYTFTIFFSFFFFSYTLQIVQIQKLNKNYIKHFKNDKTVPKTPGIAGKGYVKPQGQPEQWWRVFSTRRREKRRKMGGSGSASSPFPFPAGGDLQSTQKTQQAVDFNFFLSCSRIYFFFSVLGLLLSLQICFSLGFSFFSVSGGRMGGCVSTDGCVAAGVRFGGDG
jgi:hypothetical protein